MNTSVPQKNKLIREVTEKQKFYTPQETSAWDLQFWRGEPEACGSRVPEAHGSGAPEACGSGVPYCSPQSTQNPEPGPSLYGTSYHGPQLFATRAQLTPIHFEGVREGSAETCSLRHLSAPPGKAVCSSLVSSAWTETCSDLSRSPVRMRLDSVCSQVCGLTGGP